EVGEEEEEERVAGSGKDDLAPLWHPLPLLWWTGCRTGIHARHSCEDEHHVPARGHEDKLDHAGLPLHRAADLRARKPTRWWGSSHIFARSCTHVDDRAPASSGEPCSCLLRHDSARLR
ncbi:unnamed protein product, partial [Urochloa humidicola]